MTRATVAIALVAVMGMALWTHPAEAARRRISFEATEIEVEVQKPEVAVFISRENLHKSYRLELRESFIPKIIDSVERAPF